MKTWLFKFSDDILLIAGCIFILVGLAQWNIVITWITSGLMLIAFGVLIGKGKGLNDHK